MPDQNNQNPDQNQQNGLGTVPMIPQSDIPPLPTDFSSAPATPPVAGTPEPLITATPIPGQESGSAAPPAPAFSDITAPPKKKFGTGKIIATILGIFILVGGVAAAVLTINQKQLFQQKASGVCTCSGNGGPVAGTCSGTTCSCPAGFNVATNNCGTNYCQSNYDCASGYICYKQFAGLGTCIKSTTTSTCAGCNLDTTKSCTTNDGKAGTQTCVEGTNCAVGKGNWGSCVANTTTTCGDCAIGSTPKSCTTSDGKVGTQTCAYLPGCTVAGRGNWGSCVATSGTSGGSGSSTTTRSWPPNGTQCQISKWTGTPNSTIGGYIVFFCPNGCTTGCGETNQGVYWTNYASSSEALKALGSYCGQMDTTNSDHTYCQADPNKYYDAKIQCTSCTNPPPKTPVTNPTPTTPSVAPFCAAISTYDSNWNLLSSTDRSSLKTGDVINLCVTGSAATGTFDMARFIINGVQQTDTTATRPNSTDFCQSYTLPGGTTTFTISAQIHHSTDGWF